MLRRSFLAAVAALCLCHRAAQALPAVPYRLGDVVPPVEAEWRRLPAGTLLVNDGPKWDSARWILVHRVRGSDQIGTHRLPWGGVMSSARPWRPIESEHGETWRVVAFDIGTSDMAVRDAAEADWTVEEREWSEYVWQRLYTPRLPPPTAVELADSRRAMQELIMRCSRERTAAPS